MRASIGDVDVGDVAPRGGPWRVQDVLNWLASLGMSQYIPAFRQQHSDGAALVALSPAQLAALGVTVARQRTCCDSRRAGRRARIGTAG